MTAAPTFRTVQPPEGTEPGPREPVSPRAMIASAASERRREIAKEVRECADKLRRLVFEDSILAAHEMVAGVNQESSE